jgi:hypothetical protein
MLSNDRIEKLNELKKRLEELGAVDVKSATGKTLMEDVNQFADDAIAFFQAIEDVNQFADDAIAFFQAIEDGNYDKRPDYYKLRDKFPVFVDGFGDRYDVAKEFAVPVEEFDEYELLIAIYDLSEAYSGDAYVLMYKKDDGLLYEAHGSHCSCMGLEGQFEPESVPVEALKKRIVDNNYCYGAAAIAKPYIKELLDLIA